jgi:hypothetical protein
VLEESAEIADRLGLQFGAMYKQQARDRREQFVFRSLYEHIVDGFGAGGLHRFVAAQAKARTRTRESCPETTWVRSAVRRIPQKMNLRPTVMMSPKESRMNAAERAPTTQGFPPWKEASWTST